VQKNEIWARKLIKRFDPAYKPRWEVFDQNIERMQTETHACLDLGCGSNQVLDSHLQFRKKVELDILRPSSNKKRDNPFIQADLYKLPFKQNSFDLILLRFVVEHMENPDKALSEIARILKNNGQILILTTNIISPFIFISKLFPYRIRKLIMLILYKVKDEDVFPTFHKLNSIFAFRKLTPVLSIEDWQYLQDANWSRKFIFFLFFSWHLFTKHFHLTYLRTNILVTLKKHDPN
jgi:ubiquinone/menaquinone biosynthesis C-methylase UbiE